MINKIYKNNSSLNYIKRFVCVIIDKMNITCIKIYNELIAVTIKKGLYYQNNLNIDCIDIYYVF